VFHPDRIAAQNALFDEQYESDLRNFPTRATAYGDYRYLESWAKAEPPRTSREKRLW
jgi:hypothetical protein